MQKLSQWVGIVCTWSSPLSLSPARSKALLSSHFLTQQACGILTLCRVLCQSSYRISESGKQVWDTKVEGWAEQPPHMRLSINDSSSLPSLALGDIPWISVISFLKYSSPFFQVFLLSVLTLIGLLGLPLVSRLKSTLKVSNAGDKLAYWQTVWTCRL